MLISICIPCYRSAKTLPTVVKDIQTEFSKQTEHDYQIVLVNDCSPDNTFGVILELCKQDKKITGLDLSRNYGQASAKLAALTKAKGDVVVFMDDDGQHPAYGIFTLLDKLNEGYDVVYAHFAKKKHSSFKKVTSNMHNKLSEMMGTKPKGIYRSSFVIWSRTMVDAMLKYHSPFVSIGAFVMKITTKFANVEMEHRERLEGKSGYTLKKLFKLWLNIFISFSMVPLRMSTFMGFAFSGIGFIGAIILLIRKLINPSIAAGYTSLMMVILIMGGLMMIFLGIIGEYIGRIYMTISGLPQYNIREVTDDNNE